VKCWVPQNIGTLVSPVALIPRTQHVVGQNFDPLSVAHQPVHPSTTLRHPILIYPNPFGSANVALHPGGFYSFFTKIIEQAEAGAQESYDGWTLPPNYPELAVKPTERRGMPEVQIAAVSNSGITAPHRLLSKLSRNRRSRPVTRENCQRFANLQRELAYLQGEIIDRRHSNQSGTVTQPSQVLQLAASESICVFPVLAGSRHGE
jgi:hypothetical protein